MNKNVKKQSLEYRIDDFMIWCQQKDLRIKSITSYEACLRLFASWTICYNTHIEIVDKKQLIIKLK